jgi:hypothetical protein
MTADTESRPLLPENKDGANPPKRSQLQAYWELTRLHKFPAGSDLVFWPCGTTISKV